MWSSLHLVFISHFRSVEFSRICLHFWSIWVFHISFLLRWRLRYLTSEDFEISEFISNFLFLTSRTLCVNGLLLGLRLRLHFGYLLKLPFHRRKLRLLCFSLLAYLLCSGCKALDPIRHRTYFNYINRNAIKEYIIKLLLKNIFVTLNLIRLILQCICILWQFLLLWRTKMIESLFFVSIFLSINLWQTLKLIDVMKNKWSSRTCT